MKRIQLALLMLILSLQAVPWPAQAQEAPPTGNAICVLAYEDANANAVRDASEIPLPGITITLAVEGEVVIRSTITTTDTRRYCFDGLPDGFYILTFADGPTHRKTTTNRAELTLSNNMRATAEFGAVSLSPFEDLPDAASTTASDSLPTASRIILAIAGALLVLVLMAGLGFLIAGFML
jgi:hypothetical protein